MNGMKILTAAILCAVTALGGNFDNSGNLRDRVYPDALENCGYFSAYADPFGDTALYGGNEADVDSDLTKKSDNANNASGYDYEKISDNGAELYKPTINGNADNSQRLGVLSKEDIAEPPEVFVSDIDGLFTKDERAAITAELRETAKETGWCIGICSGFWLAGSDDMYYGTFGEKSGVILFLNKGYAKVVARGEAAEYVNGERAENIVRLAERSLRHKNPRKIPDQLEERLIACRKKGRGSFDLYPPAFMIALIFGLTAGFGTLFLISHRYSLSDPPIVNNYLDVRSIEVYRKSDELLSAQSVRYRNNIIQQAVRGEGMFRRR